MELIDKADVEKILSNLWKQDDGHNSEHRICYNKTLQEIQCELDTLEVKVMDLKSNKLYKQGWKDAVAKASIFVYQLATALPDTSYTDADNMTDGFKEYMEEQQQQKTFEQEDMDEKIRQYLLWLVKPLWEDTINNVGLKKDDIIAWIEKK